MTDYSLTILVVQGTVRDGRKSIHPARYVTERFQENGHDAELFDMKEYDIPLLRERRFRSSDPHPDIEAFGQRLKQRLQNGGDPRVRFTATDIHEAGIEWVSRMEGVADDTPRLADGRVLDADAVVWTTGFRPDYSWIEVPGVSFDEDGYPIHHRGVIDGAPGLYIVGLPYQYTLIPAISDIAIDANYIADHLLTAGNSQDTADQPVADHKASPTITHQNP